MCCCAERRAAIVSGAQAIRQGDAAAAAARAGFVVRSMGQDARAALARRVAMVRGTGR